MLVSNMTRDKMGMARRCRESVKISLLTDHARAPTANVSTRPSDQESRRRASMARAIRNRSPLAFSNATTPKPLPLTPIRKIYAAVVMIASNVPNKPTPKGPRSRPRNFTRASPTAMVTTPAFPSSAADSKRPRYADRSVDTSDTAFSRKSDPESVMLRLPRKSSVFQHMRIGQLTGQTQRFLGRRSMTDSGSLKNPAIKTEEFANNASPLKQCKRARLPYSPLFIFPARGKPTTAKCIRFGLGKDMLKLGQHSFVLQRPRNVVIREERFRQDLAEKAGILIDLTHSLHHRVGIRELVTINEAPSVKVASDFRISPINRDRICGQGMNNLLGRIAWS